MSRKNECDTSDMVYMAENDMQIIGFGIEIKVFFFILVLKKVLLHHCWQFAS